MKNNIFRDSWHVVEKFVETASNPFPNTHLYIALLNTLIFIKVYDPVKNEPIAFMSGSVSNTLEKDHGLANFVNVSGP